LATGKGVVSQAAIDALNRIKSGALDIQHGGQEVVNAHDAIHNPEVWLTSLSGKFVPQYDDLLAKVKNVLPALDTFIRACEDGVNENTNLGHQEGVL
jgi:hypothetical protein